MMMPYKQSRVPAIMEPYSPTWRPQSTCPWREPIMVAPYSSPRVPPRLVPLPGPRYGKCFCEGLFVKK
jgi:hypothetical protein